MTPFPHEPIDRLADRIARGEVVFFIGAGFSLDSEMNTADRLMGRLLARFEAMSEELSVAAAAIWSGVAPQKAEKLAAQAQALRGALVKTFGLKVQPNEEHVALLPATISQLSWDYFQANDWLCTAFNVLLDIIRQAPSENWREFLKVITACERRYLVERCYLLPGAGLDAWRPVATPAPTTGASLPDQLLTAMETAVGHHGVPVEDLRRGLRKVVDRQFFGTEYFSKNVQATLNLKEEAWNALAPALEEVARGKFLDTVPHDQLDRLDLEKMIGLGRWGGKALFLETLGFLNLQVMRGTPLAKVRAQVEESYREKVGAESVLRPRHHVLARLAREGLCPVIMTTNFDLLIEGAYHAVGFEGRRPDERRGETLPTHMPPWTSQAAPPTDLRAQSRYRSFSSISNAVAFSDFSGGGSTAVIYKIHGCVQEYRTARHAATWAASLPTIVFTFREIQNWRGDSWSRDLLQNLLRTRTIAFCGYSGMDQVIHDTFRSVYEEMAHQRELRNGRREPSDPQVEEEDTVREGPAAGGRHVTTDGETAPAFFFSMSEARRFHGLELLRAASRTVGVTLPDPTNHPNYIDFFRLPEREIPAKFPTLDESMRWLFHRVIRRQQLDALRNDLRRAYYALVRHPCDEKDLHGIIANFCDLCAEEAKAAQRWCEQPQHQAQFARMTAWTEHFHITLLRELSLAEGYLRERGPGLTLAQARVQPGYIPVSERRDWSAWMVVVELAVRRMAAVWRRADSSWKQDSKHVQPVFSPAYTGVTIQESDVFPAPIYLTIRMASPERSDRIRARRGVRHWAVWEIEHTGLPWREHPSRPTPGGRRSATPSARELFQWALGTSTVCTRAQAAAFLNDRSPE